MFSSDEISTIAKKGKDNNSIFDKYEDFLLLNGIYRSYDIEGYRKKIHGHKELSEGIIEFIKNAKLDNEKIELYRDLYAVGFNRDLLVEMILEQLRNTPTSLYVWEYCDLLYTIKNYKYIADYISIVKKSIYGSGRQMLVVLLGKSKEFKVIPELIGLLNEEDIKGHVIDALKNFRCNEVFEIMQKYQDYEVKWVRNIARDYIKKYKKTV